MARRKNRTKPVEWPMPARYQAWVSYVFDRSDDPANDWYFDFGLPDFEPDKIKQVELIAYLLEHCGHDLAKFSAHQVNYGLKYIFTNTSYDVVYTLMDESVPMPLRLRAIEAIKTLYRDCFTPRCAPVLCNCDDPGDNPLNHICYMLWDVSPLAYWEDRPNRDVFYDAVVNVLEDALTSPNPACAESALHGLGHLQPYFPQRVEGVIGVYLRPNVFVDSRLQDYARRAAMGHVQ